MSTSPTHTPGPWATYPHPDPKCSAIGIGTFKFPNHEFVGSFATVYLNADANARLIACAPDLLALAKKLLAECGSCAGTGIATVGHSVQGGEVVDHSTECEQCADIRAVISKAEGRS